MNICVDKPRLFEDEECETIDIENCVFEVTAEEHLVIQNASTKTIIGYFPKGKWDCVYPAEE